MRPIKFKAWDKTNNEWFMDGDSFDLNFSGSYGDFYFDNDHPTNMQNFELEWVEFTGLKVDGKDLYEGDIVATGQGVLDSDIGEYVIRWIDGDTGFFLTLPQECGWLCRLDQGEIEALDLKIIGNIYEDKDLLK
jgi:hypothetical protein